MTASIPMCSKWLPLREISRNATLLQLPGMSPVRCRGSDGRDYIGQTGRGLRQRLGALSRCHNTKMHYRDPHPAAPALSALRNANAYRYEASFAVVSGDAHARVLPSRPRAHLAKLTKANHVQGETFAAQHRLEVLWVATSQRLQISCRNSRTAISQYTLFISVALPRALQGLFRQEI